MQRRFAAGLQFGLSYTLSRSRDNASSLTDVLPNAFSDKGYYGALRFDRTHVLVANYIYELPFFKGGDGVLHHAVGGWEVSGINQYQSAIPRPCGPALTSQALARGQWEPVLESYGRRFDPGHRVYLVGELVQSRGVHDTGDGHLWHAIAQYAARSRFLGLGHQPAEEHT